MKNKVLFIDRDGTLIFEPEDQQIDTLAKFRLMPGVIAALKQLQVAGYRFVMVSNQDGLGSVGYPLSTFNTYQKLLIDILASEGILFDAVRICPHRPADQCRCRKPAVGLVLDYLRSQEIDCNRSFVIGDRQTDLELASALGIKGLRLGSEALTDWSAIVAAILGQPRRYQSDRVTNETSVSVIVDLDQPQSVQIETGIGFFDHMLEQLAKHGGIGLVIRVKGDLQVDEHHTIEDTALTLGATLRQALGDKRGIGRYGFVLPMDEALAMVALDLSGRPSAQIDAEFTCPREGDFSSEMLVHFLRSFAESLCASLHVQVSGENTHHMFESVFKGLGRALAQAIVRVNQTLPTTKGVL